MEQLSWIEEITKAQYMRQTERILYEYPFMKLAVEETKDDLPSMIAGYDDMPKGTTLSNPTESYGIKRAEKCLKIRKIDKAMSCLSEDERDLIQKKYFDTTQPSDETVFLELRWNHKTYYKLKERAVRKMAIALNII